MSTQLAAECGQSLPECALSEEELLAFGQEARRGRSIFNKCWRINRDLRDSVWGRVEKHQYPGPPENYADVIRVTVTNRDQTARHQKHFVTVIDSQVVTNDVVDSGYLLVDAALDQFNDWNLQRHDQPFSLGEQTSIASIVIAPPDAGIRRSIYHNMFDVNPDADVRIQLPL